MTFDYTVTPANPYNLAQAAPQTEHQFDTIYLYVSVPPEFMDPTPEPTSSSPFNYTNYIGELVSFTVKARQRNAEQLADLIVSDDPGLPNLATLSAAVEELAAPPVDPFRVSREFRWTPICGQHGRSKVRVIAQTRGSSESISKTFWINIVTPLPGLVNFDSSERCRFHLIGQHMKAGAVIY